jgi:hypothetical protein
VVVFASWEAERGALQIGERTLLDFPGGYGAPTTVRPRLGQRSFRVAVLDSYGRRCAVTSERTLPALEAAHFREFAPSLSVGMTRFACFLCCTNTLEVSWKPSLDQFNRSHETSVSDRRRPWYMPPVLISERDVRVLPSARGIPSSEMDRPAPARPPLHKT